MVAHIFLIHCDWISCLWSLTFSYFKHLGFSLGLLWMFYSNDTSRKTTKQFGNGPIMFVLDCLEREEQMNHCCGLLAYRSKGASSHGLHVVGFKFYLFINMLALSCLSLIQILSTYLLSSSHIDMVSLIAFLIDIQSPFVSFSDLCSSNFVQLFMFYINIVRLQASDAVVIINWLISGRTLSQMLELLCHLALLVSTVLIPDLSLYNLVCSLWATCSCFNIQSMFLKEIFYLVTACIRVS